MKKLPKLCVMDTNVAIVAEGRATHVPARCQDDCVEILRAIMDHGKIALDHRGLILTEYLKNLSWAAQPGLAMAFIRWAHDSQWNEERCQRCKITPRGPHGDFEEFPNGAELEKFDLSDRKFVAVAMVAKAPILNAADSDWKHHESPLAAAGIEVIFLCPEAIKA